MIPDRELLWFLDNLRQLADELKIQIFNNYSVQEFKDLIKKVEKLEELFWIHKLKSIYNIFIQVRYDLNKGKRLILSYRNQDILRQFEVNDHSYNRFESKGMFANKLVLEADKWYYDPFDVKYYLNGFAKVILYNSFEYDVESDESFTMFDDEESQEEDNNELYVISAIFNDENKKEPEKMIYVLMPKEESMSLYSNKSLILRYVPTGWTRLEIYEDNYVDKFVSLLEYKLPNEPEKLLETLMQSWDIYHNTNILLNIVRNNYIDSISIFYRADYSIHIRFKDSSIYPFITGHRYENYYIVQDLVVKKEQNKKDILNYLSNKVKISYSGYTFFFDPINNTPLYINDIKNNILYSIHKNPKIYEYDSYINKMLEVNYKRMMDRHQS